MAALSPLEEALIRVQRSRAPCIEPCRRPGCRLSYFNIRGEQKRERKERGPARPFLYLFPILSPSTMDQPPDSTYVALSSSLSLSSLQPCLIFPGSVLFSSAQLLLQCELQPSARPCPVIVHTSLRTGYTEVVIAVINLPFSLTR